jgi:hypothetical protein
MITMNQMMSDLKPGDGNNVDMVLSRYFRAEMPHPWPECAASAQARRTPPPSRFRAMGRLALAASVVLFFVGYLALAGYFPRTQPVPAEGGPGLANVPGKTQQLKNPLKNGQ